MDDPVRDIEGIVRSLTQGSPNEQAATLNRYYIPSAEFVHPFCRVPPFQNVAIPLLGEANSRQLVLAIFRWYRMISPRIDLRMNSVQFDQERNKLYLDISQRMALFFVPFYAAHVNLVTVLHLVQSGDQSRAKPDHGHGLAKEIQNGQLPSFAQVARSNQPLVSAQQKSASEGGEYYIAKQEDLYQVNEWIKFIVPFGIGNLFITIGQLIATAACLAGAIAFFPFVWLLTHGGDSGNVMPPVESVDDDGQVHWKGVGAAWAKRTFSPLNSIGRSAFQGVVVNVQANAGALVEKGEALASNVQQRAKKVIHEVQAREEALVKSAQQKAKGLADEVQQGAENFVQNAQRSAEQVLSAAQQREREFVRSAQAKEEQLVARLQGQEEQAAANTKQWWEANKKK